MTENPTELYLTSAFLRIITEKKPDTAEEPVRLFKETSDTSEKQTLNQIISCRTKENYRSPSNSSKHYKNSQPT